MEEQGTPLIPPSDLRPLASLSPDPSGGSRVKNSLIISAFVLALVAIGVWAYITYGPRLLGRSESAGEHAVAYYGTDPIPGIYLYSFTDGAGGEITFPDLGSDPKLSFVSFSPGGSYYAAAFITQPASTSALAMCPVNISDCAVIHGPAGSSFQLPIASADGKAAAFLYHLEYTKAGATGKIQNAGVNTLAYVSFAGGSSTPQFLSFSGSPLLFSPDDAKLLIVRSKDLSIVDLATSEETAVTIPQYGGQGAQFAMTADGSRLAIAFGGTILLGSLNWKTGAFTATSSFSMPADDLMFDAEGALFIRSGASLSEYDPASGETRLLPVPAGFASGPFKPFAPVTL